MEKIIRTLNEPSVDIDSIIFNQKRGMKYNNTYPISSDINEGVDISKHVGLNFPIVVINGTTYKKEDIDGIRIEVKGTYPTITIKMRPKKLNFLIFSFPKDGDVISFFYRSGLDTIKPIRCDFDIVNLKNVEDAAVIFGVLKVPRLFTDNSWSYDGTSLETLQKFAESLNLGFATNETSTDDKMVWLCPNDPSETFINKINDHAYKDENSFFETFIDHNYILNFVNLRTQLTNDIQNKIYEGIHKMKEYIESNRNSDYYSEDDSVLEVTYPTILSNWIYEPLNTNKIMTYTILNSTARVSLEDGYRKYIHHYDYNLDEKVETFTELISSKNIEPYITMKGRVSENNYKFQNRHSWEGISYSLPFHNTHKYYKYAKQHNYHNKKELEKLQIEVVLENINFNLYRYMVIPVIIYTYGREVRDAFATEDIDSPKAKTFREEEEYILNQMLSGFYMIEDMSFEFYGNYDNTATVIQRLTLSRTEWHKTVYVPNNGGTYVVNAN